MKKFILLFLGCAQICFGMFPKPKVAHHKPLIATQQPKFKIEYLALKQSFFVVKDSAFSYMGEINQGLDFGPMHYFEAKMRMLQVNGSEYLRSIKTHIQDKITELGDKNTQKPIMLKHIGFIDQILSEPDIQRIDSYQVIKKLLRDGKIDQAVSAISIYRSKYGDAGSVIALESMIDSIQRQPKSTGGAVEALVASVGVGLSMDMRVGELPSSLNIIKCSEFHPIDLEKWRQAYLVSGGGGKDFSTNSSKLSVQVVVRSCTIKKQTHSIKNVPELTNRQTLNAEIKQQCLEWQKNGEKSSIKSQIELLEKVTFGREHKKCQCKQKHNELLESLRAILDENKTDDFHIIQTGSECEAQKVLAKYEDQFLRQVQGVPIQSTGSSTSFGFSQEYYDFQQARKLFAKRFGSADGVRTQPAAATVQNCDLVSTSAPLISDVSLNDIFKNKPKLYNLDTAQDFKSIGDAVLEHCDFVLTGLSDQSGDNIQAIKQEFALEIQSAQKAESLEEFSYHLSVADLRLEMAKHILEYKELHPEFANELLEKIDRSAELLGRAITSFAQRTQDNVTHPEREVYNRVMAPIHLARLGYSVSKMASQYGYALISSESKW